MSGARRAGIPPLVVRIARIAVGLVFLVAAFGKLADPGAFALQIHNYRLAPPGSENAIAMVVPWIELVTGLALAIGIKPRAGAAIALAMMVGFTVAVGIAWARGLNIECGCFGTLGASQVGARKFAENLVLTLLAAFAVLPLRGGAVAERTNAGTEVAPAS